MGGEPAPGRLAFAILLRAAVLRRHELGRQRNDAVVPGGDQRRRQQAVEMLDLAACARTRGAVRAGELVRSEIFGAVEGDQNVAAEPAEHAEAAARFECRQRGIERRIEVPRLDRVKHGANVIVAGDLVHREQRLAVRAASP